MDHHHEHANVKLGGCMDRKEQGGGREKPLFLERQCTLDFLISMTS